MSGLAARTLWHTGLALFLNLTCSARVAGATEAPARIESTPGYHSLYLEPDGKVLPGALRALTAEIGRETRGQRAEIILLLHGYNTSFTLGRRQYREISRSLRMHAAEQSWRPVIVGIHWPSYPGPPARWLPQMLGYRFLSAAGFPKAVPNPYLEKVKIASQVGRTGLRSTIFHLNDSFPGSAVHVFAHSMGSELVVRALAPGDSNDEILVEQPDRELRLGMVVLAGADLDQDAFLPDGPDTVAAALDRVRVWWITVPRRNSADAALELRRAAGRRDAMGNVGPTLTREQFLTLITRRGLVIDNRSVPITHDITDYYASSRLESITASLLYLQGRNATAGKGSLLAILDRILKADPERLPALPNVRGASARLYIRWRREPERTDFNLVRLSESGASDAGR